MSTEPPAAQENLATVVNYNMPIQYCNHVHIMNTSDGYIFEFRAVSPTVFQPGEAHVGVELALIPPFTKMMMTENSVKQLGTAISEILAGKKDASPSK